LPTSKIASFSIGLCATALLTAQDLRLPQDVKTIGDQISTLANLTDDARAGKIKELSPRILQQPSKYVVSLAVNLVNSGAEGSERDTLQTIATTLAGALRKAPVIDQRDDVYLTLARLVRYNHLEASLDNSRYRSEMKQLEDSDRERAKVDFTLADLDGRNWTLKQLHGSVVLVNFWDSWCEPCRREIPGLDELHKRFGDKGLVILTVFAEDAAALRRFVSQRKIGTPALIDPGQKVKQSLHIQGSPASFVYDRDGKLVAQAFDRPAMSGWRDMLARAGLK
jgi:thiol-disulfide isomerase/thioredoxin